ncbi:MULTISPECIES: hypothetical protein [Alkalimonas]|uniref:Uncharacterized protein n=1 Tax=Alkalimonas mucilaginosa TaxID=3057676 RepID=A0ABU7JGZ0_9GAMM|nr:hypothetical protein [Alkalimonas sp. MEB004]MEE2024907.1 hypothetical protein [Alkalimonas sp. MEB004]
MKYFNPLRQAVASFQPLLYGFIAALFGGMAFSGQAQEWQWHGFMAQGMIQADKSNFINRSGDPSFALTEVGLNASLQLQPSFRLAGQVVYLDGGNRYPDGLKLDYLFVDWSLMSQLDWQINAYAGRFKNQHWLYSSTRDVPLTRPSIVLPQSVYFDAFRDIAVSSDGVALKARVNSAVGHWELNWSLGATPLSDKQTSLLLGESVLGKSQQKYVHQASMFWQPELSNWTLGISLLDSEFSFRRAEGDDFWDADFVVQRVMFNAQYQQERWQLVSEIFQERMDTRGFFSPAFEVQQFGQGGYLQGSYQLNSKLRFNATMDYFVANKDDRQGRQLAEASQGMVPEHFGYQHSFMLAASRELAPRVRLQLEHHWVHGTGRLAPVIVPELDKNRQPYWQLWAVQLMYWF